MNKTISILGCGWLGLPLAIKLIAAGWQVNGSTTNPDKVEILQENGINPYLLQLKDVSTGTSSTFWDSDILLINVPPGLKTQNSEAYLNQMQQLVDVVIASGIPEVLFISSTSVYPELNKVVMNVDETDENSALLKSEKLFTSSTAFKTTVLRFGGLIGPGRHPSRFFAGKKDVPNGNAPVNLIHLDDCICIIEALVQQDQLGETYHAAAPSHPSRKEFYTKAAEKAGLLPPEFIDELKEWKIIDPVKVVTTLNYDFIYGDLMKWLDA